MALFKSPAFTFLGRASAKVAGRVAAVAVSPPALVVEAALEAGNQLLRAASSYAQYTAQKEITRQKEQQLEAIRESLDVMIREERQRAQAAVQTEQERLLGDLKRDKQQMEAALVRMQTDIENEKKRLDIAHEENIQRYEYITVARRSLASTLKHVDQLLDGAGEEDFAWVSELHEQRRIALGEYEKLLALLTR